MTSPPQPAPGGGKSAGQYLRPLRNLAVYALIGATAGWLFVALIRLIPDGPNQFAGRTEDSFYGFVNLQTIFFPLAGVLLAVAVQPRHPKARLIVLAAVAEYAVAAFFGVFFGVLIGLVNHASNNGARIAFEELLVRVAWLAVFAVAAYALYQIWLNQARTPRPPKPGAQPGTYGQPQYGPPGAYPGQPNFGPPPPGGGPPGATYPPPGYTPAPPPGNYGQQPAWNQPVSAAPGQFPEPPQAAPQHQPPQYQPSQNQPSQNQPPQNQPLQHQAPPHHPERQPDQADRTEPIDEIRPGFGPAEQ